MALACWEKTVTKHIFVVSSAGKPIFSRYGDEQDLVTTFGLIQAVISIVQDISDQLQCIQAGSRRIVYFSKHSLYFVVVSSTGEPPAVLRQQLEFVYSQIVFVLTSKVHDILKSNPSKDIRELLGSDTKRLMHAICKDDITAPTIVFNSVKGFALDASARLLLLDLLNQCLLQSKAALGCIICEDSLLVYTSNADMQVMIDVKDILLLTHFVHNSPSLRCHHQNNWVPLCLPSLNAAGYVQAFISPLELKGESRTSSTQLKAEPSLMSLILITASNGSGDDVKRLHEARITIHNEICNSSVASRLDAAVINQDSICQKLLSTVNGIHFFYKYKSSSENPSQCLWSNSGTIPISSDESQSDFENKIWLQCYRLALCLREGSGTPECTLISSSELKADNVQNALVDPDTPKANAEIDMSERRAHSNAFSSNPAADHALCYSVLNSGEICVGLATSNSELFVTFPHTIDALEACSLANLMTRYLRKDADSLFFCC